MTFFSRLTTGFFSSLTFAFPFAAPFAFLASGFSSSLLSSSSLTSFLTFLTLLVDARGFAAAFFFANGFSSSDSDSSLSEYFGFAFARPFVAFALRAAGFLAERGVSSSERSESLAGVWTRLFGCTLAYTLDVYFFEIRHLQIQVLALQQLRTMLIHCHCVFHSRLWPSYSDPVSDQSCRNPEYEPTRGLSSSLLLPSPFAAGGLLFPFAPLPLVLASGISSSLLCPSASTSGT